MKRIGSLLLYGFLTWFAALAVSMAVYPLKKSQDPLFETVMTLTLAALAVLATLAHFHRVRRFYLLEGFLLGASLFLVNVVLDLPLFMFGPMAMPVSSYLGDIGLTYLVYPIVTVGSSILLSAGVARARSELLAATAPADVAGEVEPVPESEATASPAVETTAAATGSPEVAAEVKPESEEAAVGLPVG